MVHILFDTNTVSYDDFLPMRGDGVSDEYFKGAAPFQRGYGQKGAGVGDIMRGIWRYFLPIMKKVGTTVSEEALNTGQRALSRVIQGEPVKEALVSEGKKGIDTVLEKGGLPKQFGAGRGIKRKPVPSHQKFLKRKRLRSDTFGFY
ncbi:unnamed protein product [Meloidogyne enterolobii]|uniref:Uncharacterized protein n=1 Tax=Meloidogyne enterolobii TaxID=390850 RepID=A0ACB0YEW7_MELEN